MGNRTLCKRFVVALVGGALPFLGLMADAAAGPIEDTLRLLGAAHDKYPNAGALSVGIAPDEALADGAQLQIDGGALRGPGTVNDFPVGNHTVTFSDVPGWTTPASIIATVAEGLLTSVTGAYVALFPATPQNVSATDGEFTDKVRVSWDAVAEKTIVYQVLRAQTSYYADAVIIADWLSETQFDDVTATAWTTPAAKALNDALQGCNRNCGDNGGDGGSSSPTYYHYWVNAFNTAGFQSKQGDPDAGHRGQAAAAKNESASTIPGDLILVGLLMALAAGGAIAKRRVA